MRVRRVSSALAAVTTGILLFTACGKADQANSADTSTPSPRVTSSAIASDGTTTDSDGLPSEAEATQPGDGKDVAQEIKSIEAGTPDPCRLISMKQYSKIVGQPMYIKSHGGGPYYPEGRRNCFLTKNKGDNALTGDLLSIHKDNGEITSDQGTCAIGPLGYAQEEEGCTIVNLDPYEIGFDSTEDSPNIPSAWLKLVRSPDGVDFMVLHMTTSNGLIFYLTHYGTNHNELVGLGRVIGNSLRVQLSLNK